MTSLSTLKSQRLLPGPGLRNLVLIEGAFKTLTELHVGSGGTRDARDQDLPLKRMLVEPDPRWNGDPDDRDPRAPCRPYVPSTSTRGTLRAWCTSVLAPFGPEVALVGMARPEPVDLDVQHPDDAGVDAVHDADVRRAEKLRDELDLISGLFGSTRWRGKVEIRAARLKEGDALVPGVVKRVALDPHLGAAEHGKLFSVEHVPPGHSFEITLVARNVVAWELGLLLHALDSFNHPHFATRLGALNGHDWGRVRWFERGVSLLGAIPDGDDQPASNPLKDWLTARVHGQEARKLDAAATKHLRQRATDALHQALVGLGGR